MYEYYNHMSRSIMGDEQKTSQTSIQEVEKGLKIKYQNRKNVKEQLNSYKSQKNFLT